MALGGIGCLGGWLGVPHTYGIVLSVTQMAGKNVSKTVQ